MPTLRVGMSLLHPIGWVVCAAHAVKDFAALRHKKPREKRGGATRKVLAMQLCCQERDRVEGAGNVVVNHGCFQFGVAEAF